MFASLRSRLAISNLLITLLGLLVVVALSTQQEAQRSVDIKEQDLQKQSRAIAKEVERVYARHGTFPQLQTRIYLASRLLGERIIVLPPRGHRAAVDSARGTDYFTGSVYRLVAEELKDGQSTTATLGGQQVILFRSQIHGTHGHPNGGSILLVAPANAVSLDWPALLRVGSLALGVALVVWLLIGFYFTFSISRPLLRITAATREMTRGNYAARVDAAGHGEIAALATSFNRMAQQVQQTNQVLKDFLASASHDLRTPLTMIAGFSQALLDGTARPDEVEESAAVIHEEAVKMQHLVDDLLQLTRLESGLLTLDRHPIQLRPFVQRTIDRVTRAHGGETAMMQNLCSPDLPPVDVDPERMERVLRNLLENALQYTPADGRIMVYARRRGERWVEISVGDTGVGIPTADLPRIFERFYRADKGRERGYGHSGLGLAIVKEIVEAHGGRVSVESESGHGTVFRFTVPQAARSQAEPPAGQLEEPVRQVVGS